MNIHIELVKKWLENKDSVSLEELKYNAKAAKAANAAYDAAYYAAGAIYADDSAYWVDRAAYWVNRFEELTK